MDRSAPCALATSTAAKRGPIVSKISACRAYRLMRATLYTQVTRLRSKFQHARACHSNSDHSAFRVYFRHGMCSALHCRKLNERTGCKPCTKNKTRARAIARTKTPNLSLNASGLYFASRAAHGAWQYHEGFERRQSEFLITCLDIACLKLYLSQSHNLPHGKLLGICPLLNGPLEDRYGFPRSRWHVSAGKLTAIAGLPIVQYRAHCRLLSPAFVMENPPSETHASCAGMYAYIHKCVPGECAHLCARQGLVDSNIGNGLFVEK